MITAKKILMTGGGTGGSVSPLIALAEELYNNSNDQKLEFFWYGTNTGPEKSIIANFNSTNAFKIEYMPILSGKWRRYFSWLNFVDLFLIIAAFFQSLIKLLFLKPDIMISAGSFVSVPVAWSCWLLRIPIFIQQQDLAPGLANKLMSPFAAAISVTFEQSLRDFPRQAVWAGNILRSEFKLMRYTRQESRQKLNLDLNQPVVLILGGGTGSAYINDLVGRNLDELLKFTQIIHVTGKDRGIANQDGTAGGYKQFEFLHTDGIIKAYTAADIVVSRCGLSVLTELSYLGKPSILIPMPDSHQEINAEEFADKHAAIILNQADISDDIFIATVRSLLHDPEKQSSLSKNIKHIVKVDTQSQNINIIKNLLKFS